MKRSCWPKVGFFWEDGCREVPFFWGNSPWWGFAGIEGSNNRESPPGFWVCPHRSRSRVWSMYELRNMEDVARPGRSNSSPDHRQKYKSTGSHLVRKPRAYPIFEALETFVIIWSSLKPRFVQCQKIQFFILTAQCFCDQACPYDFSKSHIFVCPNCFPIPQSVPK